MPWSNQGGNGGNGGGPWKGGGPWGQGPSSGGGGGGNQPDIEDILRRGQDRLKRAMPGQGPNKFLMFLIGLIAAGVVAFYGFTVTVEPDELGIVTRFGQVHRQLSPGLNFRLPPPIEEVMLPKVTRLNRTEVGFRSGNDSRNSSSTDNAGESLILTGDEKLVDVDFVVLWQVKDATELLFNVRDGEAFLEDLPAQTVKDVAESAMREIVGKSDIRNILTADRAKIEADAMALIQKTLDSYKAGILVTQVQLLKVDPPGDVIDAYRDVQAAKSDQERLTNEAKAYAGKVEPEARGNAAQIIQAAEGYKSQVIAEAQGQANRFIKVYDEYKKAPDVTRRRIYLETMERVFGGMDKVIIDQGANGGSGVVPFLPLNDLNKRNASQGTP